MRRLERENEDLTLVVKNFLRKNKIGEWHYLSMAAHMGINVAPES